ncbi:MAG: hypothetical protein ACPF9D_07800 [Owenweeksia sp.]
MRTVIFTMLAGLIMLLAQSCYYDNKEELYQNLNNSSNCKTDSVSFQATVFPIITSSCATSSGCHLGANPSGVRDFSNYASIKASVDASGNGSLIGRITNTTGSLMPLGGPALPDCEIKKIQAWAAAGAPNN